MAFSYPKEKRRQVGSRSILVLSQAHRSGIRLPRVAAYLSFAELKCSIQLKTTHPLELEFLFSTSSLQRQVFSHLPPGVLPSREVSAAAGRTAAVRGREGHG